MLEHLGEQLFASVFVVGVAGLPPSEDANYGPTIGARIAAVAVLCGTGLLAWRFTSGLPRQARTVVVAALRADRLLAVTAVVVPLAVAALLAVVVTGYGLVVMTVWCVVFVMFVRALDAGIRDRRRRAR